MKCTRIGWESPQPGGLGARSVQQRQGLHRAFSQPDLQRSFQLGSGLSMAVLACRPADGARASGCLDHLKMAADSLALLAVKPRISRSREQ